MLPAAGLVLALLSLAPAESSVDDEAGASEDELVLIECFVPEELDGEFLRPQSAERIVWRSHGPSWLIRVRTSFFETMVDRAAGL